MSILNTLKKPFVVVSKILEGFYKGVKGCFVVIKNFFNFIKALIDLIYKLLFIAFFCAIGYVAYKVWTGSADIKNKLTEIEKNVSDIKTITDSLKQTTDAINNAKAKANEKTTKLSDTFKKLF